MLCCVHDVIEHTVPQLLYARTPFLLTGERGKWEG